jgi:hypothetical protein
MRLIRGLNCAGRTAPVTLGRPDRWSIAAPLVRKPTRRDAFQGRGRGFIRPYRLRLAV